MRDPYTGLQTRFHRTDPTGRWQPICAKTVVEPFWPSVLGGAIIGIVLAVGLFFGMSA